jgi:hypothetical protein
MARKTSKSKHRLARGHLAVGLGLLSGACGADSQTGERATDDPGIEPVGHAGGGAGGSIGFIDGNGGSSLADAAPARAPCDLGDASPSAQELLAPYVADGAHVGVRTVYTWTSQAQIDELRQDPTLLTRSASVVGERGRATDYLLSRAATDDIAAILSRPEFEKKRFGWTNAWATALGWEGETYGDQLLEIRLRADAWIGRLSTRTGEWAFFDTSNRPVALEAVRQSPDRIAAFYFADDAARGCGGTLFGQPPYREYVVCNEAMIESWSASTPELLAHLTTAISALEALRDALARAGCTASSESVGCFQTEVIAVWDSPRKDLVGAFEGSLAFPNELYVPTVINVENLIQSLQNLLFVPSPLRHSYQGDAGP